MVAVAVAVPWPIAVNIKKIVIIIIIINRVVSCLGCIVGDEERVTAGARNAKLVRADASITMIKRARLVATRVNPVPQDVTPAVSTQVSHRQRVA